MEVSAKAIFSGEQMVKELLWSSDPLKIQSFLFPYEKRYTNFRYERTVNI